MANDDISPEEMFAILNAGGRINKERSYATESKNYRDPSEAVKYENERERKRQERKNKYWNE